MPDSNAVIEHVLHAIVERKHAGDLRSSLDDKRFSEQRHRLQRAGFRSTIFLVEVRNNYILEFDYYYYFDGSCFFFIFLKKRETKLNLLKMIFLNKN